MPTATDMFSMETVPEGSSSAANAAVEKRTPTARARTRVNKRVAFFILVTSIFFVFLVGG